MLPSLILGLNEKDMQAIVDTYDLTDFYYPTLFPLKKTYSLEWKALQATAGVRVAADVVARGASISEKKRTPLSEIRGDIPKLAIKRKMDENELYKYRYLSAITQSDADQRELVETWAGDMNFCWTGVASRIEWLALQTASLAEVTLTKDNNDGAITEYSVAYPVDDSHKVGFSAKSAAWSDSESAKPISVDFFNVIKAAKKEKVKLRYAFMNVDTFCAFAQTAEVTKLCASFAANALNIAQAPTLDQINATLGAHAEWNKIQVIVIDQDITIENGVGEQTSGNPFADNVVMFSPTKELGQTLWVEPVDNSVTGSVAKMVMNSHTLIKKYADEEPVAEYTSGIANAFPVWYGAKKCWFLDTANSTWKKGAAA